MAIKAAELFSTDPAHAFDFAPVAPSAIFNNGMMPRYQQLSNDWMGDEGDAAPETPAAAAPTGFTRSAAQAFAPQDNGFQLPAPRAREVAGTPATPPETDFSAPVSDQYGDYADFIFQSEARRGKDGALQVYSPPAGDGGGAYEVAGITARYQPKEAAQLRSLIESGKTSEAEAYAKDFYRRRAAPFTQFTTNRGLQLQLADTAHHRGEGGLRRVLQRATGSDSKSYEELISGLSSQPDALDKFNEARQSYEWDEVDRGRASRQKFRKGLQNRFDKAYQASLQFNS